VRRLSRRTLPRENNATDRLQTKTDDGLARMGVLPGEEPVEPPPAVTGVDSGLGPAPGEVLLLVVEPEGPGLAMGDGLEAPLSPPALEGGELEASPDGDDFFRAIAVDHDVVGRVFAEAPHARLAAWEAALVCVELAGVGGVREDQPGSADFLNLHRDR